MKFWIQKRTDLVHFLVSWHFFCSLGLMLVVVLKDFRLLGVLFITAMFLFMSMFLKAKIVPPPLGLVMCCCSLCCRWRAIPPVVH